MARSEAKLLAVATVPRLMFAGLLLLLVWAPIPLASNRTWAMGVLAACSAALLLPTLAYKAARLWRGRASHRDGRRALLPDSAWWPCALLCGYSVLVAAQLVPLPALVRALFVPGAEAAGPVSVDAFATARYLMTSIAYASVVVLVLLLVDSPRRLRWLMGALLASGIAQGALAVHLLSLREEYQYLFTNFPLDGRAVGTFANANHLAGYLEIALAVAVGLLLSTETRRGNPHSLQWRTGLARVLAFAMSPKMLVRLLVVLMVIALVLTRSRGGNAAFLVALLLTGAWVAYRSARLRTLAVAVVVSMVLVDMVVLGQWVGLDQIVQRFAATAQERQREVQAQTDRAPSDLARSELPREESLGERLQVAQSALVMVAERPLLGFGGGTFHSAFQAFKSPATEGQFDHAHNDFVEIAAEAGLPGLLLLLGFAGAAVWRAARLVSDRSDGLSRGVAVTVCMAAASLGLHSWVDFNLQVPANAMTLCAVLALAWCLPMAQARGHERRRRRRRQSVPQPQEDVPQASTLEGLDEDVPDAQPTAPARRLPWRALLAACALGLVSTWAAWHGLTILRADLMSVVARQNVSAWSKDGRGWTVENWQATREDLLGALAVTPGDPMLHGYLAELYMTQAVVAWRDLAQRTAYAAEAADHLEALLRLRQRDGLAWYALGQARYAQGRPAAELHEAWRQALRFAPNELAVQRGLESLVLATWDSATPEMRAWLRKRWESAGPEARRQLKGEAARHGRADLLN